MTLVELTPDLVEAPLPAKTSALLADADTRIHQFVEGRLEDPILGFVPSDFVRVWCGLRTISERGLAPGRSFCEWGSGFGVITAMAAQLAFDACGIEIHQSLVEEAQELVADHDILAEFICGSYMPEGSEPLAEVSTSDFAWIETHSESAYDELGLDIGDFDVIYAYPWPGEEELVHVLFDQYASDGAVLLTYNATEDLRFRRKVGRRR